MGVLFTGLGSLPGTDIGAALRMTFDKVPELPYLPELPARGPWAAMIGRGLGLPSALPVALDAGEWRISDASGVDQRRARATWRDDLDLLEEAAQGYAGPFKVAIAGPWTLAAALGIAHAGRVLADPGARRDLAGSLAEGAGELLAELHRRLPDLELALQVDEPGLPAVAAGAVPTPGGYFRHRAVDLPELCAALGTIVAEPARRGLAVPTVLHSCAPWSGGWPLPSLLKGDATAAGFDGFSFDLDQLAPADLDQLAWAADSGATLYLGVLPTQAPSLSSDELRRRTLRFCERVGLSTEAATRLVLTPSCGLAGWTTADVSRGFQVLSAAAAQVGEELGLG